LAAKQNGRRKVDLVIISDVHLGTYGCQAKELLQYLKSIKPKHIVLNGDIIDIWQFSKRYWPKSHMRVVKHLLGMHTKGVEITYIPGNHDEMLRRFSGIKFGGISITNKLILNLNGKKAWIFHGDVFDVTMQYSKWLAKLGAVGYDALILINAFVNFVFSKIGKDKISLSKKVKNGVKKAVKFINDFEDTAAGIAISNKYDYVVCGHIHHPEIKEIVQEHGKVTYLNSGDWIENLSALEYHKGAWRLFRFEKDNQPELALLDEEDEIDNNKQLFEKLMVEFDIKTLQKVK
jgi:UDP-2,3-diacylglucosamine pyrophosphatase LpxH